MSATAETIESNPARQRPRFRLRRDLRIEPQLYAGEPCFIVKDPVGLTYFRFSPRQRELLGLIEDRTVPEIHEAAGRLRGAPPSEAEVTQFVEQLSASGLVVRDSVGTGRVLHEISLRKRRLKRKAWLQSLLYIKLPGIDPQGLLDRMHPWLRWVYSTWGVAAAVCLILFAGGFMLVHLDELLRRFQAESIEQFFSVRTILWLWVALGVSKVVHEFGHGLTCKHFGGECHDMGLLFLVFSPCLFCDATDAWTMPNKWHRIAVSFGGIYVELVIASVSALVWWHTTDGVLHNIALALMTLCSLNTFLLNANPLMRFDGYYVLSDLLEIPNLRVKARLALRSFVNRHLLGLPTDVSAAGTTGGRKWLFVTYAVASWLYQWLLCAAILLFFYKVLQPYRLGSVSVLLAVAVAVQMILVPLWRNAMNVWSRRSGAGAVRWGRLLTTLGALGAVAAAAVFAPIPQRVRAQFIIAGEGRRIVRVSVPGRLEAAPVRDGTAVHAGDVLARLSNAPLEVEVARLAGEVREFSAMAEKYAALQQPAEEQAIRALVARYEEELATRLRQREELTIRADRDGLVVFAPRAPETLRAADGYADLPRWTRTPLAEQNIGCHVEARTPLCEVLPNRRREAVLYVDQSDLPFVAVGDEVRLKLDSLPCESLLAEVIEISRMEAENVPPQLLTTGGGDLPARQEQGGTLSNATTCYEVRVAVRESGDREWAARIGRLGIGSRGIAKISCGTTTCVRWAYRKLCSVLAV